MKSRSSLARIVIFASLLALLVSSIPALPGLVAIAQAAPKVCTYVGQVSDTVTGILEKIKASGWTKADFLKANPRLQKAMPITGLKGILMVVPCLATIPSRSEEIDLQRQKRLHPGWDCRIIGGEADNTQLPPVHNGGKAICTMPKTRVIPLPFYPRR